MIQSCKRAATKYWMYTMFKHSQMKASLGIEVNDCVVEKLIIVQAAEVMLSQLHNIQLPSRWIHTPHVLHHADPYNFRLEEGVDLQLIQSGCGVQYRPSLLFW